MKSRFWIILLAALLILIGCVQRMASPPVEPSPTPGPSLRSLAQLRGLYIGTAVFPQGLSDPAYAGLLASEFNALTPENAMKWESIHPDPDRYDFSGGDTIVAFAQAHGMVVRGHTLVWDNQLPKWVTEGQFTRDEWKTILHDHINTVVGHYRGQVFAWDVVNEAFDEDGLLRDTIWLRALGPEYIALAFRWAHAADPEALLFYNDNGGEGLKRKSQAIYALVQGLLQAGVPIHGVGLQMHVWLNGQPSPQALKANISRLAALGLQVHITEMDVRLQASPKCRQDDSSCEAEKLEAQARMYGDIFAACLEAPNCKAFMTWGLTDRYSWIPSFTGKPDAPLLFDQKGQPKPAYYAIFNVLMGK